MEGRAAAAGEAIEEVGAGALAGAGTDVESGVSAGSGVGAVVLVGEGVDERAGAGAVAGEGVGAIVEKAGLAGGDGAVAAPVTVGGAPFPPAGADADVSVDAKAAAAEDVGVGDAEGSMRGVDDAGSDRGGGPETDVGADTEAAAALDAGAKVAPGTMAEPPLEPGIELASRVLVLVAAEPGAEPPSGPRAEAEVVAIELDVPPGSSASPASAMG